MHSALAVTYETFDMDMAASELADQIRKTLPPAKNHCAILFADPGYDWESLLPKLQEMLAMDIIGASAVTMLSSQGYHSMGATLLVLAADDCVFGAAISPPLENEDAEQQLRQTYDRAVAKLQGMQAKVIFTFSSSNSNLTEDHRLRLLGEFSGNLPIFGGVAADHFEFANIRVFGEGQALEGAMSILLIAGNIRPRFVMRNVPRKHLSRSRITSSTGNVIHTIDNIPAYEYMVRHGIDSSTPMSLQFTPLLVDTQEDDQDNAHTICRPFFNLDEASGSGSISSDISPGTGVTVQTIQSSDIGDATRNAMETLMAEIAEDKDYHYSTIIGISCAGRLMVLAFDKQREAELALSIFPSHLTFSGFYSLGEFCPITTGPEGADNRLHNLSLGLCAI